MLDLDWVDLSGHAESRRVARLHNSGHRLPSPLGFGSNRLDESRFLVRRDSLSRRAPRLEAFVKQMLAVLALGYVLHEDSLRILLQECLPCEQVYLIVGRSCGARV